MGKTLTQLFNICNASRSYQEVGENVNYMFQEDGDTLYIYFQPSRGKVDWRHNFAFWKKPYKGMKIPYRVHGGFLECWKYVDDIVIEKVTEKDAADGFRWKRIVITGYSHGGALAMLCHECVWYHRPDLRKGKLLTFAFEAPRVYAGFWMWGKLKERWEGFTIFRNQHDIVTHVPPVLFGFRHVGELRKMGAKPDMKGAFKKMFKCLFKRDWKGLKDAAGVFFGVRAHYPAEVLKGLAKIEDGREY